MLPFNFTIDRKNIQVIHVLNNRIRLTYTIFKSEVAGKHFNACQDEHEITNIGANCAIVMRDVCTERAPTSCKARPETGNPS